MNEKNLKNIYLKVIKSFSEINPTEIKLVYDPHSPDYAGMTMVNPEIYHLTGKFVISPTLLVGHSFLTLTKKEQEASMIHEIGHYKRFRRYIHKPNRIIKIPKWYSELTDLEEGKSRREKLQKWEIMHEVYADNQTLKAGYGSQMLAILKKANDYNDQMIGLLKKINYNGFLVQIKEQNKKMMNIRIANLEERLSIEK